MSSIIHKLEHRKVIHPPPWLANNLLYLAQVGSVAYGFSQDVSDVDCYGIVIEPREYLFPGQFGLLLGFDDIPVFKQWQEHDRTDEDKDVNYDFTVYGLVRYFELLRDSNPNIIDSIFVPRECILYSTSIAELIRENRHLFLSKLCIPALRGYAFSQMKKLDRKPEGKRAELVEKWGFDVKYAAHLQRLLLQCEQILEEGDLDLRRNSEQLKSVRRGEWTLEQVREFFYQKERLLDELSERTTLPAKPPVDQIKQLLVRCLEHH